MQSLDWSLLGTSLRPPPSKRFSVDDLVQLRCSEMNRTKEEKGLEFDLNTTGMKTPLGPPLTN